MKKERTPAQKLGWYKAKLREEWRRSPMYWEAWHRAWRSAGILECEKCKAAVNAKLIEMDHVEPVCAPGQDPLDIALWAQRLNCPASGLLALCESCHGAKTAGENRKRVKRVTL